jgi:hypothetical protein
MSEQLPCRLKFTNWHPKLWQQKRSDDCDNITNNTNIDNLNNNNNNHEDEDDKTLIADLKDSPITSCDSIYGSVK